MSKVDLSQLKPVEARALIVLMTHARALTNKELSQAGAELKSENHQQLSTLGLVTVTKPGRSNVFDLTDRGWQALREPYASDPEAGAGKFLLSLLTTLQRCLDRVKISHGEFFVPDLSPPKTAVAKARTAKTEASALKDVKACIRAAYEGLPKGPGGYIGLADLRDELSGLDRKVVDLALTEMSHEPDVHVTPVANRKSLTKRDRDAALRIGEDETSMISIGAS